MIIFIVVVVVLLVVVIVVGVVVVVVEVCCQRQFGKIAVAPITISIGIMFPWSSILWT